MRKATIIHNPLAGSSNLLPVLKAAMAEWQLAGWQIKFVQTAYAGHATTLAKTAVSAGCDLVFAAGGDGTLGEVANGLVHTKCALATLPIGTANAFATELGLPLPSRWRPQRLLDASRTLLHGHVQRIDVGYLRRDDRLDNGRYWLLWAGVGADGTIVQRVEPRPPWSKRLGKLGYLLQGSRHLAALTPFSVALTVDGRQFTCSVIQLLASNVRIYAGAAMTLTKQTKLDDGQLDIWLMQVNSSSTLISLGLKTMWQGEAKDARIGRINGRSLTIQTETPINCQTDGDSAGQTPLTITLCPLSLRLLVPSTAPTNLFSKTGEPL